MGIETDADSGITVTNSSKGWHWRFYQNPEDRPGSTHKRFLWCTNRETLEELKRGDYETAEVLISLVDDRGKETRHMAHLADMQALVPLPRPGYYKIYATVFLKRDAWWKGLRVDFLRRAYSGDYRYPLNDSAEDDGLLGPRFDHYRPIQFEVVELATSVSADHFAAPPPRWITWWVDFMHSEPSSETCVFRERLVAAILLKPWLVLALGMLAFVGWLGTLIMTITVVALTGLYGMDWKWFVRPTLQHSPGHTLTDVSWITHDERRGHRSGWRMRTFLIPWVQIVLVGAAYLAAWLLPSMRHVSSFSNEWLNFYLDIAIVYLLWATILTWTDYLKARKLSSRSLEDIAREQEERRRQETAKLDAFEVRFGPLVCDGSGTVAEAPAFSWRNPRPALLRWYQDLKADRCKQYAP